MARGIQKIEIDGVTYQIGMIEPMAALDLFQDLIKMVGPGLSPILGSFDLIDQLMERARNPDKTMPLDVETSFLSEAAIALCSGVDKTVTRNAVNLFKAVTIVEANADGGGALSNIFDAHFRGEPLRMLKWMKAAFEVNYGPFFDAFKSALKTSPSAAEVKAPEKK